MAQKQKGVADAMIEAHQSTTKSFMQARPAPPPMK
jgi:hypothetical protein